MLLTPNLLVHSDGSPVEKNSWFLRRQELAAAIISHQFGDMPPKPTNIDIIRRANNRIHDWDGAEYATYQIDVWFHDIPPISLTISLWIPSGDGPFCTVLDIDGCWRYFNDQVIHSILKRGYIAASIDRTQVAADNKDSYRNTGLYRLFPSAKFGVCAAWAWAVHRSVDALITIERVNSEAIAITGHSRGGKTALLAGATDERVAITNPNNSGVGGAAPNRLKMKGSEVIDSFFDSGNIFWFGEKFASYRDRDDQLPYDNHYLHALVAPRKLLLTEAYEDHAANPAGTYAAAISTQQVYQMLKQKKSIGWSYRESGHAHLLEDYTALLDFMDFHFRHKKNNRDFQRNLYPDLDTILTTS